MAEEKTETKKTDEATDKAPSAKQVHEQKLKSYQEDLDRLRKEHE